MNKMELDYKALGEAMLKKTSFFDKAFMLQFTQTQILTYFIEQFYDLHHSK